MKASETLATVFLGVWLILGGLLPLLGLNSPLISKILFLLAIVTGLLLLFGKVSFNSKLGVVCLGLWLIVKAILPYVDLSIPFIYMLLNLLGLVSGILILLGR